jgi:poly-gamma-glutamate system protein
VKRVYWRPRTVSQTVVVLVAVLSVLGMLAVEFFRVETKQPFYEEKTAAVELAVECMQRVKQARLDLGHVIDPEADPAETGLIGAQMTPVTTVPGHLPSKQVSVNPNFAAVLVDMLTRAGVEEGDLVAVGCSGSFPALNVATYAALEVLKAKPVVISSAGASQYGANFPDFLWIDIERELYEAGLISFKSVACSLGGQEDLGLNMTDEAKRLVTEAIERNGLKLIQAPTYAEAIQERTNLFEQYARGQDYACYVNVGGGTVSVGRTLGKKLYDPGLNLNPPNLAKKIDSVMSEFARRGVPIIHLTLIEQLAVEYGLTPPVTDEFVVGQGTVFLREQRSRWLALAVLLGVLLSLRALVLTDLGFRLLKGRAAKKSAGEPEPMV